jgi:hypothetical protein
MLLDCSEVLLVLRAYAFWEGNKRLLYGLIAYAAVRDRYSENLLKKVLTRL